MNNLNELKSLAEKYNVNIVDITKDVSYYAEVQKILYELKFLNELVYRTKKNTLFSFGVVPSDIFWIKYFWIVKKEFTEILTGGYYFSSEHEKRNRLEYLLQLAIFCSRTMYIDGNSNVEYAKRFMELLEDNEFALILKPFGETPKSIAREDCFYYEDEVWEIVKDFFQKQ